MLARMIQRLTEKPSRLAIGLMSGTSVDGVDAALVRIEGHGTATRIQTLAYACFPFEEPQRQRIHAGFSGNAADLCALNFELGERFAEAALGIAQRAGVPMSDVDFVASHGQTIYHIPPAMAREAGIMASTLQIGEGAVIAQQTGRLAITDFRTADVAAGGDGAPLVPYFDFCILNDPNARRVAGNIGGIANITRVAGRIDDVIAFDTGPGNVLLDAVAQIIDPNLRYDRDGHLAAQGTEDPALLAELLAHPYFQRKPPKSTGRELFGAPVGRELAERVGKAHLHDLMATLVAFTAESIALGVREYAGPADELVLAGGGIHHPLLMERIRRALPGIEVRTTADFGIDPDAKEAIAFALLGNETLHGSPSNVPSATGACATAILGKISVPPHASASG